MASPIAKDVMVVWDFDYSLINTDSDHALLETLAPELREEFERRSATETWHELIADLFSRVDDNLAPAGGLTEEAIAGVMQKMPIFPEVLAVVRALHEAGVPQAIVSDANDIFIGTFLAHHGLTAAFEAADGSSAPCVRNADVAPPSGCAPARVFTNTLVPGPGAKLGAFSEAHPHTCPGCPRNLCKGKVMRECILPSECRIVYVGDGSGDMCAARTLRRTDLLCARANFPMALKMFGPALGSGAGIIAAPVIDFFDHAEGPSSAALYASVEVDEKPVPLGDISIDTLSATDADESFRSPTPPILSSAASISLSLADDDDASERWGATRAAPDGPHSRVSLWAHGAELAASIRIFTGLPLPAPTGTRATLVGRLSDRLRAELAGRVTLRTAPVATPKVLSPGISGSAAVDFPSDLPAELSLELSSELHRAGLTA